MVRLRCSRKGGSLLSLWERVGVRAGLRRRRVRGVPPCLDRAAEPASGRPLPPRPPRCGPASCRSSRPRTRRRLHEVARVAGKVGRVGRVPETTVEDRRRAGVGLGRERQARVLGKLAQYVEQPLRSQHAVRPDHGDIRRLQRLGDIGRRVAGQRPPILHERHLRHDRQIADIARATRTASTISDRLLNVSNISTSMPLLGQRRDLLRERQLRSSGAGIGVW